ncbi:MAG: hypothetical protein CMJ58_17350 [Planctomycetaceae bacterium]|nr:hypothetical protein [Planctomycetaceae bacterium]
MQDIGARADMNSTGSLSVGEIDSLCEILDGHFAATAMKSAVAGDDGPAKRAERFVCVGCGEELSAVVLTPGRNAVALRCESCQRWHFVDDSQDDVTVPTDDAGAATTVSLENFALCPDARTQRLIEHLLGIGEDSSEHRRAVRAPICAPILCVPLSDALEPAGRVAPAMILDLSATGACIATRGNPTACHYVLDLSATGCRGAQVLGSVRWQRPERGGVTTVGCEFIHKPGEPLPLPDENV